MLYAKSTKGFYDPIIHDGNIPNDAVAIPDSYYFELLEGQAEGKLIEGNDAGYPVLTPLKFSMTYADYRLMEYPSITEYIDGVVKGDQAQIDAYIAKCLAVKSKYPKG